MSISRSMACCSKAVAAELRMSRSLMPFLRPYLFTSSRPAITAQQANAYQAVQRRCECTGATRVSLSAAVRHRQSRLEKNRKEGADAFYPRVGEMGYQHLMTPRQFHDRYADPKKHADAKRTEVFGRIGSIRDAGNKFYFVDLERSDSKRRDGRLQAIFNLRVVSGDVEDFKQTRRALRRGDWISVKGFPTLSSAGELSIEAQESPVVLSPCLKEIPTALESKETMSTYPHMKTLVHRNSPDMLYLRHRLKQTMVEYFYMNSFIEVSTPILERAAGGAIARPFETTSNNIADTTLNLRIAPELSLKRLIIGGQERIFEIGPVFRNEGVDSTHNPEFTMCEFYEVGAPLEKLMHRTVQLMSSLRQVAQEIKTRAGDGTSEWPDVDIPAERWPELNFCKTIELKIGQVLPNLQDDNARDRLSTILTTCDIPHELSTTTLPQMLELLAEKYIEPLCVGPTWITYHPECLSPLAKSFSDLDSGQRLAARAELFIAGNEIVNCYEEENSPFEQRRKFEDQIRLRTVAGDSGSSDPDGPPPTVDEGYLEALQWGMPPTGGWGCGFDRLVMLFSGEKRIADVLPLGSLKNVVARAQLLNHGATANTAGVAGTVDSSGQKEKAHDAVE